MRLGLVGHRSIALEGQLLLVEALDTAKLQLTGNGEGAGDLGIADQLGTSGRELEHLLAAACDVETIAHA